MKVKFRLHTVVLVFLAVVLGAAYAALDMYSKGQQDAITVEIRAQNLSNALSRFKRDAGGLPKTLEELAPTHIPALGKCPDGTAFTYLPQVSGEYRLSCPVVYFGSKPYVYDSKSRAWTEGS